MVEVLYTGFEMESYFVYAQILTNFFACLTFSAGVPILYIVGFFFQLILYWVYKVLLLKYYKKTVSFNEELAVKAIDLLQIALIFHILIAAFIYSNSSIFGRSPNIEENFFYNYIANNYPGM